MPKYLFQLAYTPESLAAQMKNPEDRIEAVGRQLEQSVGVKTLAGGYSFGEYDLTLIMEAPDEAAMAGVAIAVSAGGAIKSLKTTPLLDGAQWVAAMKKATAVAYKPKR